MPYFIVKGAGKETNRKRTKRYKAKDEEQAKDLAEKDGTDVENILFEKPSPATEPQKNYAKDLGLYFPADINIDEMSHLISKKVGNDVDSPNWLQDFAIKYFPEENGLAITKYIGLESLLGFLIYKFNEEERIVDVIKLLIYAIINNESKSNWEIPFDNLANDNEVQSLAEILVSNKQVANSIKRLYPRDYISFGETTDKEGYINYGGSKKTNAYIITKKLLNEKNLIKNIQL